MQIKQWAQVACCTLLIGFLTLGLASCGGGDTIQETEESQEVSKPEPIFTEVAPPAIFEELRKTLDNYQPQVSIIRPDNGDVIEDTTVSLEVDVQDYPLFKREELGMGPHLHVILDNEPYRAVYNTEEPIVFEDLAPGTHTIRMFASRPWHESFKNEGAYDQVTFHLFTETGDHAPDPDKPLLTYSRPKGSYGAEPILLDYYLTNAPIQQFEQEGETVNPTTQREWRVRATINGESFIMDSWMPIHLKGFDQGKNWIKLELLDGDGNLIENEFNRAARLVSYQPKGQDTLSKLVRGELSLEKARLIVDQDYELPAEKPEEEKEAAEEEPVTEQEDVTPKEEAVTEEQVTEQQQVTPEQEQAVEQEDKVTEQEAVEEQEKVQPEQKSVTEQKEVTPEQEQAVEQEDKVTEQEAVEEQEKVKPKQQQKAAKEETITEEEAITEEETTPESAEEPVKKEETETEEQGAAEEKEQVKPQQQQKAAEEETVTKQEEVCPKQEQFVEQEEEVTEQESVTDEKEQATPAEEETEKTTSETTFEEEQMPAESTAVEEEKAKPATPDTATDKQETATQQEEDVTPTEKEVKSQETVTEPESDVNTTAESKTADEAAMEKAETVKESEIESDGQASVDEKEMTETSNSSSPSDQEYSKAAKAGQNAS